jgi:hypothetical protein
VANIEASAAYAAAASYGLAAVERQYSAASFYNLYVFSVFLVLFGVK